MDQSLVSRFQAVGGELFRCRLVSNHGGNLSVRLGGSIVVTGHGSRLGALAGKDLVETGLKPDEKADGNASMEVAVHRAIYSSTEAGAVVHAHPAHAIALSLNVREIVPPDVEGAVILGRVPVVGWGEKPGPGQGAEIIAKALAGHKVVMVHGHGCFAIGEDLEEACDYAMILEESCRIQYLAHAFGARCGDL